MDFKKYLANKCIIGYGIINGLINAGIFYLINKSNMNAMYTFSHALQELCFTTFLLGMILTWCVVPLTKMDLTKGTYTKGQLATWAYKLPGKAIALSVVVGIICVIAGAAVSALLIAVLGGSFTAHTMLILKGVVCAVIGALAGYLVIQSVTAHNSPLSHFS